MSRGFTLAEMIVVLAILGITAAAVVPAFTRLAPADDLARVTAQVEEVIGAARGTALQRATNVEVTFVPQSGRYWLRLGDGTALDSGAIDLGNSVSLHSTAPRPRIRFTRLGMVDADSLIVVGPSGAHTFLFDRWTGGPRAGSQ